MKRISDLEANMRCLEIRRKYKGFECPSCSTTLEEIRSKLWQEIPKGLFSKGGDNKTGKGNLHP